MTKCDLCNDLLNSESGKDFISIFTPPKNQEEKDDLEYLGDQNVKRDVCSSCIAMIVGHQNFGQITKVPFKEKK